MSNFVPCPYCQGQSMPVSFTWWGGVLGPKMFSHCKCLRCGKTYNGKTGKSNDRAITIYVVVSLALGFGLLFLLLVGGVLSALFH